MTEPAGTWQELQWDASVRRFARKWPGERPQLVDDPRRTAEQTARMQQQLDAAIARVGAPIIDRSLPPRPPAQPARRRAFGRSTEVQR